MLESGRAPYTCQCEGGLVTDQRSCSCGGQETYEKWLRDKAEESCRVEHTASNGGRLNSQLLSQEDNLRKQKIRRALNPDGWRPLAS